MRKTTLELTKGFKLQEREKLIGDSVYVINKKLGDELQLLIYVSKRGNKYVITPN